MRKDALTIVLITAVAGIFGGFLRWLQRMNAFEAGTGLPVRGAATSVVFALYLLLCAALFLAVTVLLKKNFSFPAERSAALRASTVLPGLLSRVCGAVMAVVCVLLMFRAGGERYPMLTRVFAAGGILGGAGLLLGMDVGSGKEGAAFPSLLPVIFGCLWVLCCYKDNADNPVLWAFVPELLAAAAATMAWYETAAYYYGKAKPAEALFFLQAGYIYI